MLTKADLKWLNHLSTSEKIKIVPYNPKVKKVFEHQKKEILGILGNVEVLHMGASNLGISGQKEIDIVIPVSLDHFGEFIEKFKKAYGEPKSFYPNDRVRFQRRFSDLRIEMVIVNADSEGWKKNMAFDSYIKRNPDALEFYRKLKEGNNGLSVREYYKRKIKFINKILKKVKF